MKIYTRTGDTGETSLFGGERRSKADQRVVSYGAVDELQAVLGLVIAELQVGKVAWQADVQALIQEVQHDGFVLCCELARTSTNPERNDPELASERVAWLEESIDTYEAGLPGLTAFIMQGGSRIGAHLHLARAVCRRAEREVIALAAEEPVPSICVKYLNRLSDLLFVLARYANHKLKQPEVTWEDQKKKLKSERT